MLLPWRSSGPIPVCRNLLLQNFKEVLLKLVLDLRIVTKLEHAFHHAFFHFLVDPIVDLLLPLSLVQLVEEHLVVGVELHQGVNFLALQLLQLCLIGGHVRLHIQICIPRTLR